MEEPEVSTLNPLATLHWEECAQLPVPVKNHQCVILNDVLYIGGGWTSSTTTNDQLFVSPTHHIKWSTRSTPTSLFALTTYHSQLVLVGGTAGDKLLTSNAGMDWKASLPPMPTSRYAASAVNTGSPECLIVAGGRSGRENMPVDIVEVLIESKWWTVEPLPRICSYMQTTVHDGKWFLAGGGRACFYCDMKSLLVQCQQSHVNKGSPVPLWSLSQAPSLHSSLASFGRSLISIGGDPPDIAALSPLSQVWVPVGKVPVSLKSIAASIALTTGDLIVVGGETKEGFSDNVFKASLRVSPYDPDSLFSMNSLSKLQEGAGIKIVSSLAEIPMQLVSVAGVHLNENGKRALTRARTKGASLEIIVSQWESGSSQRPPTWQSLLAILQELDLKELSQEIEDYMHGKFKYLDAYRHVLATRDSIDMWFIKVILLGAPRLGKTTVCRRLTGEIADISSSGEAVQPSTGAVESGVVITNISSTTAVVTSSEWEVSKDLTEEAHMLLRFIYSHTSEKKATKSRDDSPVVKVGTSAAEEIEAAPDAIPIIPQEFTRADSRPSASPLLQQGNIHQSSGMSEVAKLFRKAIDSKYWKDISHLFTESDMALVKMEDTGGQPELMDMLSALTIGPALYLLFCKLIDDLQSSYTVSYLSPSGETTTPVQSTYTVEELLLTALASASCCRSYSSTSATWSKESTSIHEDELLASCNKSVAYILGTHKDLASEQQIAEFDEKLQHSIRSTDFFRDGLVQFSSEDRMVLPIDNMHGGEGEIKKVRTFLEEGMKRHFKKLSIPAAWLILSLCLRKREERTSSLQSVLQLAGELGIPEEEVKLALWFLHHYAGVLMYFPQVAELKDIVICDTQVVYDSATNLIVNTFKFVKVGKAASEKFRKTGQFSLEDIHEATAGVSGDFIPLQKLVSLLQYLNIIAPITNLAHSQASSPQSSKVTYFMPCVLQNATREELDKWWDSNSSPLSPAHLFIRYQCGFALIGVFPAMIANLAGNKSLQLITENIKKNLVQFRMLGGDYDTVTLISQPKYYAVHITRLSSAQTPTHEVCGAVRGLVESTLKTVTSHMNYSFSAEYQLSFECPSHPGREHLCTVQNTRQVLWEGCSFSAYVCSLSPAARPNLELLLDWGHDGVDRDLIEIAHHMLHWEEKLCSHLGLTAVDIHDIKAIHHNKPELQRREVLRRWKSNQGLGATYGNLLELFVKARHTDCAEALCKVLRKKCGDHDASNPTFPHHLVSTGEASLHMMDCLKDKKAIKMLSQHLVWYNKPHCCVRADIEHCAGGSCLKRGYLELTHLIHSSTGSCGWLVPVLVVLGAILVAISVMLWTQY